MTKIEQLRMFQLFGGVSEITLTRLAQCAVNRRYPRGCTLYCEGDPADALYLLVEGRAKAQITDASGREVIVNLLESGDTFGEMELLDMQPRGTDVVTMSSCEMLVIARAEFMQVMEQSIVLMQGLLLQLASRLRQAQRNIGNLATLDVVGRVERLLIEHAVESDGVVIVRDLPSQREIASMVGASREMVNRVFKHLTLNGYLTCCDGRFVLRKEGVAA